MLIADLFCGEGGVAYGLLPYASHITGIDHNPRCGKRYPGHAFLCDDWHNIVTIQWLRQFDFIWASPPCQRWSIGTNARGAERNLKHPDHITPIQKLLRESRVPYAIENVPRAPIRSDIVLTGRNVGLDRIVRERHFEVSWPVLYRPQPIKASREEWESGYMATITKSMSATSHYEPRRRIGLPGRVPVWEAKLIMGIPLCSKMTGKGVGESVPPAMAAYVIRDYLRYLSQTRPLLAQKHPRNTPEWLWP